MDYQAPTLHPGKADVSLKRSVLDLACLVCGLHNSIRSPERLIHVADLTLVGCGDILMDVRMKRELVDYFTFPRVTGLFVILIKIRRSSRAIFHNSVVDKRGSRSHGLLYCKDSGKNLIVNLDLSAGLSGSLKCFCNHCGNPVAHVAHLHVEEPPVMRTWLRVSLSCLHIVSFWCIEGGENLNHALNLPCLGVVYAVDVCACVRASEDNHVAGVRGDIVLNKRPLTCDKLRSVYLGCRLSDNI